MEVLYKVVAIASGGRAGRVEVGGGDLAFSLAQPVELGGNGKGTNPEQLFAAAYASCFSGALAHVAREKGVKTDGSTVSVEAGIGKEGEGFALAANITVKLPGMGRDQAETLAREAHGFCPYSKALKGNIPIGLKVEV